MRRPYQVRSYKDTLQVDRETPSGVIATVASGYPKTMEKEAHKKADDLNEVYERAFLAALTGTAALGECVAHVVAQRAHEIALAATEIGL